MDIGELRSRFEAYAAGTVSAAELRAAVRAAVLGNPALAPVVGAFASAWLRSGLVDDALYAALVADARQSPAGADAPVEAPAGPARAVDPAGSAPTADRPPTAAAEPPAALAAPGGSDRTVFAPRGMPPTGIRPDPADAPSRLSAVEEDDDPASPPALSLPSFAAVTGTGTGTGVGTAGTGSAWDSPERLADPVVPLQVGDVLKHRYVLEAELGRGGMGVVYRALDRASAELKDRQQHVAIKVLSDDFRRHPLAVRSLQREARKAQKLAHPNIVTVHDFDRDGGHVYMVMELLEGHSLDQVVKAEGAQGLPLPCAIAIVNSLADALAYAHEQGFVHSDFKPSNAFLTDDGTVKVLDLGIARAAQKRTEGAGDRTLFDPSQLGAVSPPYASPEMLRGEEPDARDDLYALACVTYELVAGRHPFNRIDAEKARESKLVPARPKRLSRAQWAVLSQGLAFERAQRVGSAREFAARFAGTGASPARLRWAVAAALALVVLIALAIGPRQWEAFQARGLVAELGAPASLAPALERLRAAPDSLRSRVVGEEPARRALVDHYARLAQAAAAAPRYDYVAARAALGEAATLLPDSGALSDLRQRLDRAARAELLAQLELRDRLLADGRLIPQQGPENLATVLERVRRIDPVHASLRDPRLPGAYATAARGALDGGQPDLFRALVDAGLALDGTDPRLLDLKDRVGFEQQRAAAARRATELESRLGALDVAAPDFLERLRAARDDVAALLLAVPDGDTSRRLQQGLEVAVRARVAQRLAGGDITGAQELLLYYGDLLPESYVAQGRATVLAAARAQETRAFDTLDRLRRAALTGRIAQTGGSGALDLYQELQQTGAGPDVLAEARDLIAYGYLREARRARLGGDTSRAARQLGAADALQPGDGVRGLLGNERGLLDAKARRPAVAEVDAARGQFTQSLRAPQFGIAEVIATGAALDRLESLGASPQEVGAGLRQAEDRVLGEVARLGQQSGPDAALAYARQAGAILPAGDRIAEENRKLRGALAQGLPALAVAAAAPEADGVRTQLAALVAKPQPTAAWGADLRRALQRLGAVASPGDPALAEARRVAVDVYAQAAATARGQRRYSEATQLLNLARQIDPEAPRLAQERTAIEADRGALEAEAAGAEQRAGVEALKQRLADQAAAGNVAGALQAAQQVQRVLGGSVYAQREVPALIVQAHARAAQAHMAAGRVDDALQTIAAGRKRYGSSVELKALESRYVAVGDVYDRISTAISLNVAEQRRALDALKALDAGEFPVTERMLARTLANRIADQRAANRASVVTRLLDDGRRVFPEHVALLEQGIAGALPTTALPVEVPTEGAAGQ